MNSLWSFIFVTQLAAAAFGQMTSIVNSKHNLSASGPGAIRANTEQEICVFCHTAHNSAPIQPLWNRNVPVNAYIPYTSNSLQSAPGQPTGSSKLCLSCHDGTIALGSVLSRQQAIEMAGGITTLPPGASNLGTDLSDDHPISFRYDTNLAAKNLKLKQPAQLPQAIKLDPGQELQCTSCHDAHNDYYGKFLVMDNSNSQLCNSCHQQGTTTITEHGQCNSCHKTHTAPSGPYLLKTATVTDTCTSCHNATNPLTNIAADLAKVDKHDTHSAVNLKNEIPNNTVCSDCHESHTMQNLTATAPQISPKLGNIDGINAAGAIVTRAQYEYEVCFKCHYTQVGVQPVVSRQIVQYNKRLQFDTSAVSFHPVETVGKNPSVPSLAPGLTVSSMTYCTDCHASDTSHLAGGSGPNGPHGSNNMPLLIARYDTVDNTAESALAYALCYRCHTRTSILANQSFPSHRLHVVDKLTPCSVCHDSHGISSAQGTSLNHSHLINFDVTIVQPDPISKRLEYDAQGIGHGTCYLNCHGVAHSPKSY